MRLATVLCSRDKTKDYSHKCWKLTTSPVVPLITSNGQSKNKYQVLRNICFTVAPLNLQRQEKKLILYNFPCYICSSRSMAPHTSVHYCEIWSFLSLCEWSLIKVSHSVCTISKNSFSCAQRPHDIQETVPVYSNEYSRPTYIGLQHWVYIHRPATQPINKWSSRQQQKCIVVFTA